MRDVMKYPKIAHKYKGTKTFLSVMWEVKEIQVPGRLSSGSMSSSL